MTDITIPLPPAYAYGLLWLLGIGIASALIAWGLPRKDGDNGLGKVAAMFGLTKPPAHLVVIGAIIWCLIFALLVIGILSAIHDLIVHPFTAMPAEANWLSTLLGIAPPASDWRYALFKLTALTATTGVVVTLPFTLIRLRLSNEANDNAAATLFNEKFKAASEALSARRTVTFTARNVTWKLNGETHSHLEREDTPFTPPDGATAIARSPWTIHSIEEPDIVTRATAIDQIEQLVRERPIEGSRVASMLSIYVRDHAEEVPPVKRPTDKELEDWYRDKRSISSWLTILGESADKPEELATKAYIAWCANLKAERPDISKAARSLGELRRINGVDSSGILIDLRNANLQGFDLSGLDFSKCRLEGAHLQGSNLASAIFSGAKLDQAQLQGANCYKTDFSGASFIGVHAEGSSMNAAKIAATDWFSAHLDQATLRNTDARGVSLRGTSLKGTQLNQSRLWGADLSYARFDTKTRLVGAELKGATISLLFDELPTSIEPFLADIFCDGSMLPNVPDRPEHWLDHQLDWVEFQEKWHAWQETLPDFDPSWRGE